MKLTKLQIVLGLLGALALFLSLGKVFPRQPLSSFAAPRKRSVSAITESIRITKGDGVKSLGQLIRELPPESASIPNQAIKSFHFLVDPFNDALIFPTVPGFQPEGFQWGILPGQDKKFTIPEIELKAPEGLNFFLVKTKTTCNFLLIIEFYPD